MVIFFQKLLKAVTLSKRCGLQPKEAGSAVKAYLCRCKSFVNGSLKCWPTSHIKHVKEEGEGDYFRSACF